MAVARHLFERAVIAGREVQLNVPTRELTSGFAPQAYDYTAGYLWMLALGIVGLSNTFIFVRRERKGLIRKRGLEEVGAIPSAAGQPPLALDAGQFEVSPKTGATVFYTPGFVLHKIGFLLISLVLFFLGAVRLVPDLTLLATGNRELAEVLRIIKIGQGVPEERISQDDQWRSVEYLRDRSSTYWNEFSFQPAEGGAPVAFRSAFGSHFRPLNPLLDTDGLPTTRWVYYDPPDPTRILEPFELRNWFLPLALTILGLSGSAIAGMLLFYARRPIPVPFVALTTPQP